MITHVAFLRDGEVYSLPSPNRHHHIFAILPHGDCENCIQGFLDGDGKFLTREEAYLAATTSGQINRRAGGYNGTLLFSEDIW